MELKLRQKACRLGLKPASVMLMGKTPGFVSLLLNLGCPLLLSCERGEKVSQFLMALLQLARRIQIDVLDSFCNVWSETHIGYTIPLIGIKAPAFTGFQIRFIVVHRLLVPPNSN